MEWNIAAECISVVILCIIWMYSLQSHPVPTLTNKMFQICLFTTFLAMVSNVMSTMFIQYYDIVPIWLNMLVTTVYFIATPLMGLVYFSYSAALLFENQSRFPKYVFIFYVPSAVYFLLVLLNPFNGCLFQLSAHSGYIRGPLILTTYLVFYIYCLACLGLVIFAGSNVEKNIRKILTAFPVIATLVVIVQQLFPNIMLSGSAATCALLIIYLNLQNKQIYNDYLLGIPNRQEFRRMLQLNIKKDKRAPFINVVLSLRNFKQVNDTYGPNCGDEFLKQISCYLNKLFKPSQIYRFSGDEFAVLIHGDNLELVDQRIAEFLDRMEKPWHFEDYSGTIGAAVGVASYPYISDNMQGVLNAIEYSISYAKSGKEGNVCRCSQDMLEKSKRKMQVVTIIKEALEKGGFEVFYQPIWSVEDNKFTMCESLLRLPVTPLGPLYPDEFIPLAEETGLIVPITYQVLERVCKFIRNLLEKGEEIDSISVNFSAVQFNDDDLEKKVLDIISQNQIPYSKIKIEITESLLAENLERVENFIRAMHSHGIQIEMDDFGTGYCNLASVLSFPVDIVKIDKSLLWSAAENPKSAIMMRGIVSVVHDLGMRVVTEGVETQEQRDFVESCGCEWIQGYLFAKPMPRELAGEKFESGT